MRYRQCAIVMKRNFGSLNLAALDLSSPFQRGADGAECSLVDSFSALDPSAEDCSLDASGSEYSSDENVGFPMERLDMPRANVHQLNIDQDMGGDVVPEFTLPTRSQSTCQSRSENGNARASRLHPASSQHLHDQHQVELNALRCLSLKVMLSNLTTSNNSSNSTDASNKPSYSYPGVNDHAKTALLPIRQPSLQSV
ncbi:hypothetical protein GN244_ATG08029 [Phytophthora infestans]|uniref:Uncharacterized protein n=1 Tax=Phytophthora infestans TaxID=4787 RepID=A0A833SDZ5_PHYIN|nr:hypothetical protein GN244_ATG08029 [Phytophthora infestans]KAF4145777.1 hypothetical protein GN958_ATG05024 [Phytophthora infestans]